MSAKADRPPRRPGQVTILGWLLLLQALILLGIGIYHFAITHFAPILLWEWIRSFVGTTSEPLTAQRFLAELFSRAATQKVLTTLIESLVLFWLTLLTLVTALGFFSLWRFAWLLAVFIQGSTMGLALIIYFVKKPVHIYLLMLWGIFMVIYLYLPGVRQAFTHGGPWTPDVSQTREFVQGES
jgi:magnesium-transporting ATPase (P-type)